MIKKITPFVLLIVFSSVLTAQDGTYETNKNKEHKLDSADMLLGEVYAIPFQDELFNCMFAKEIMRENNVNFNELRSLMKAALMTQLTQALSDSLSALSYTKMPETTQKQNDFATANTMTYVYRELPAGNQKDEKKSLKERLKLKKEKKKKQDGTYIQDGQVVTERSKTEKYMDVEFKNDDLLFFLKDIHKTKYIITINQFDMTIPPNAGQLQIQHNKFQRQIRAHYSIFDTEGNHIHGGIATIDFPPNENNLKVINEKVMAELAGGLANTFYTAVNKHQNK